MNGTICHWDEKGKFGFIDVPGQERTIFFHNSRQRTFYCGLDAVVYDDGGWEREPVKGDKVIILELGKAKKGPKATRWALAETKEKAEELLALLPVYRLRHRCGREKVSRLDPTPTLRTIWEGKDLLDLKKASKHIRVERDEHDFYFFETLVREPVVSVLETPEGPKEVTTYQDSWEQCGDPRPR